ncbi:MAG: AMP-binding protein [Pseudomonadota bacterium]
MTIDDVRQRTIHSVLKAKVKQYANREFFRWNDQVFGFEDFDRQSDRVAAGLHSLGIHKGDKVGIMMGNRPEFLFLWFGLSKLGAVEVPLNTAHRGDLLTYMVDTSDCRILVTASEFLDRVAPVLGNLPTLEKIVVLDDGQEMLPALNTPGMRYCELIDNDGAFDPVDVLWSDPFVILFTSGTTGPSKGSLMPHNYALHMGEIISEACEYDEKDVLYNALPLFHGNAQLLSTMPALMSGAKMVLVEKFSASRFWEDIRRYGCTEFNYIGGILPILLKADPTPGDGQNPLRIMMGAGAPMDLFGVIEKRFGVTLIEGYGMSEIGTPLMNTLKERKPGTCGKPFRDYTVKLVGDDGLDVGINTPGELLIRPLRPHTMVLEYYKMPEKTVEAWGDLWFHTGDYLSRDEDGYYHFVDRKKDALRRRGENISSYEVEKAINSHPSVLESAAVAVKSDLGEDEVMICLTLKPGKALSPVELMAYCEERMAHFMIPRYVRIMTEMPKTPTQRVLKYQLRQESVTSDTWDREAAGYRLKR